MRTVLLLLLAVPACDPVAPRPLTCSGHCASDPVAHCVTERHVTCTHDEECASGLICNPPQARPSACEQDVETECRATSVRPERLALINGFATDSMQMQIVSAPETSFQWVAPKGAKYIACALFGCNPIMGSRDQHGDFDYANASALGEPLRFIVNAQACVVSLRLATTSRDTLPLSEGVFEQPTDLCTTDEVYEQVPSMLAAACWAYDDFHVVAASELIPVDPATASGVPADTTCAHDGDGCFAHRFFGRCVGAGAVAECLPRCIDPRDCEDHAQEYLGEQPGPVCKWSCTRPADSLVGVCHRM